jgi:phage-related protein
MKQAFFLGNARKCLIDFPVEARREAGYQLSQVQEGKEPSDWKAMPTIGAGVREIRINVMGAFRVIYLATLPDNVYVIHAFAKKTPRTSKTDVDLAKSRFKQLMEAKK